MAGWAQIVVEYLERRRLGCFWNLVVIEPAVIKPLEQDWIEL
jgi:hypothetical protein